MNIGKREARHLLDVVTYLRKAVAIAQSEALILPVVEQLALERCIEIADEAFQRAGPLALDDFEESLQLDLFRLRQMISRDYHLVDPEVLRKSSLASFPKLIRKIETMEDELFQKGGLKRPPAS